MSTITITATFRNGLGAPATGLSPSLKIYTAAGVLVTTGSPLPAMTEIADGFYNYTFSTYDPTISYLFIADGGSSLDDDRRYVTGNSDDLPLVARFDTNRRLIDETANQLIVYEDDGVTPMYVFNLKDSGGVASTTEIFETDPL